MMLVHVSLSSFKDGRWYEHLIRFALGGLATMATGLISSKFGPSIGGLFLALPAIFCASATLIEKHEIRRKHQAGLKGTRRGEEAAALDAAGATLGSVGMFAFAACFFLLVEDNITLAFLAASSMWLLASLAAWLIRRKARWTSRSREQSAIPRNPA